jgi:hypothetical protein
MDFALSLSGAFVIGFELSDVFSGTNILGYQSVPAQRSSRANTIYLITPKIWPLNRYISQISAKLLCRIRRRRKFIVPAD